MLNSTPEYVAAHQSDLAAMAPPKGSTAALAAKRAHKRALIHALMTRIIGIPRVIWSRVTRAAQKPVAGSQ